MKGQAQRQQEARQDLERLREEGDALGALFGRARVASADSADPVELWGRRIGRTLAVIAAVALLIYLLAAHVR